MGRKVSLEQKTEAVRMVLEGGLSVRAVAEQLGLGMSTVDKAIKQHRERHGEALNETEREELKRLKRECSELRMERDILKKAAAYFAKHQA